jgi:hypothetical protein
VLSVGWLALAVVVAILLSMWVTFTITRLDRLHARVDAAWAALDGQLVRRAAALLHAAESPDSGAPQRLRPPSEQAAKQALGIKDAKRHASVDLDDYRATRQAAENAVGRMLGELGEVAVMLHPRAADELREGAVRVQVARRFYNDAVRDTRALRSRRMPRLLRLAGHRAMPQFFDIDDSATIPEFLPTQPATQIPTMQKDDV